MEVKEFFDQATYTLTYVVYDEITKDAVVIDPVWDYDAASSSLVANKVGQVVNFIKDHDLKLHFIFETHAHADHISGAQLIKKTYPQAQIAIGANITKVQSLFKGFFNLTEEFAQDGSQFDRLLTEDETLRAGALEIKTLFTPGHTPACVSLLVNGKALFTGDTLFMPDYGTGRCDFPAGSSEDLYESITQKLYTLPDETRVYVGHDYQPHGRALQWETTIGASKAMNIQLNQNTSKDEFVSSRDQRDAKLAPPKLLFPSVEININAGRLPEAEGNGRRYLKIPIEIKETVSP